MKSLPPISAQIDEKIINKIIQKKFALLSSYYYSFMSNWLIRAYKRYNDIDKFIIIIYLIHKNLIFYRKNGLVIDKFLIIIYLIHQNLILRDFL
jgi:hypothetical protein